MCGATEDGGRVGVWRWGWPPPCSCDLPLATGAASEQANTKPRSSTSGTTHIAWIDAYGTTTAAALPCSTSAPSHKLAVNLPRGESRLISGSRPRLLPGSTAAGAAGVVSGVVGEPAAAADGVVAGPGGAAAS